ncbi:MAG: adenylate kinase [Nitrososphaerales archaeon]|nr:adenylate kinase [Nitrososphaerales archaeon]
MNLRVVVVGIAGVGKTTVVDKLRSTLTGSELVTFGTVMLEEGKRLRWIKHRDELRKLSVAKQRRLQTMAATKISRARGKILFIDTHLFIRTKEGFWPGLPFDVVRALKPTHLVLVEASPDEILVRRGSDRTRYRDDVTHEELDTELSLARSFLTVSSTLTGAPMLIAVNSQGKSDEVAANIAKVLTEASA